MRFLSVCSGIEAASVAWHPLGFETVAVSEIDKFPSAVLAHHYPHVPNLGDMTKFQEWPDYEFDILVGGTPCQSFSVAGLRKGLADPRGNLMLTYLAIAWRYKPRWIAWENVPGVLSSAGGRDFGTFLGALGQVGYGWAYRVLDAQYFGVPQRRRRVFVVGYLGDWRRAAAVLFERHSLQGHPPPSREKREGPTYPVAPCIGASGRGFERTGNPRGQDCVVAGTIGSSMGQNRGLGSEQEIDPIVPEIAHATTTHQAKGGELIQCAPVASTLNAHYGSKWGLEDQHINQGAPLFVTHSLRGEGFDASEDGTGRGTPLVPIAFNHQDNHAFRASSSSTNPLRANQTEAVAYPMHGGMIGRQEKNGPGGSGFGDAGDPSYTLTSGEMVTHGVVQAMQVRRLTPKECSRLQGFPDNYLDIIYNKKPAKDGSKYKALGNSMAVPVMRYIGERIQLVNWLHEGIPPRPDDLY